MTVKCVPMPWVRLDIELPIPSPPSHIWVSPAVLLIASERNSTEGSEIFCANSSHALGVDETASGAYPILTGTSSFTLRMVRAVRTVSTFGVEVRSSITKLWKAPMSLVTQ